MRGKVSFEGHGWVAPPPLQCDWMGRQVPVWGGMQCGHSSEPADLFWVLFRGDRLGEALSVENPNQNEVQGQEHCYPLSYLCKKPRCKALQELSNQGLGKPHKFLHMIINFQCL